MYDSDKSIVQKSFSLRTCPGMKIRFLLLLLIFAGLIVVAGCTNVQARPLIPEKPGELYIDICYPYNFMENGDLHVKVYQSGLFFKNSYPEAGASNNLENATLMLDRNIQKAENTSVKLEAGIQRYKAEGKNVSSLESSLKEYKLFIEKAKEYRANANTSNSSSNFSNTSWESDKRKSSYFFTCINPSNNLTNCSCRNVERENLVKSQDSMLQANNVLENLFEEFQNLTPGDQELNNTSRLLAAGKGRGLLIGNFTLKMHVENGELAIPEFSPDSEINIEGNYTLEKKNDTNGEMRIYRIQNANVKISGSDKTIMLKGTNLSINANGEGYSDFVGMGKYRVEDSGGIPAEDLWEPPFFTEEIDPEFEPPEWEIDFDNFEPPIEDEFFKDEFEASEHEFEEMEHQIEDFEPSDHDFDSEEFEPSDVEIDSNDFETFEDEMSPDDFEPSGDEFDPEDFNPSDSEIDQIDSEDFEPSEDEIDQVEDQIDQIEREMDSDNFKPSEGEWL